MRKLIVAYSGEVVGNKVRDGRELVTFEFETDGDKPSWSRRVQIDVPTPVMPLRKLAVMTIEVVDEVSEL